MERIGLKLKGDWWTVWKERDLPQQGCFGYIGGELLIGQAHHQQIMGALQNNGWDWSDLFSAPQAWGWFNVKVQSGWDSATQEFTYDFPTTHLELMFTSDAGIMDDEMVQAAGGEFARLYNMPVKQTALSGSRNRERINENAYGEGLRGKHNVDSYKPDGRNFHRTKDVMGNIPEPPEKVEGEDPWQALMDMPDAEGWVAPEPESEPQLEIPTEVPSDVPPVGSILTSKTIGDYSYLVAGYDDKGRMHLVGQTGTTFGHDTWHEPDDYKIWLKDYTITPPAPSDKLPGADFPPPHAVPELKPVPSAEEVSEAIENLWTDDGQGKYAIFAMDHESNKMRVSEWSDDWHGTIDAWDILSKGHSAGEWPSINFFAVRDKLDEKWNTAPYVDIQTLPKKTSSFQKFADWNDLMEKAQRLRSEQKVNVVNNAPDHVVGEVEGDHGQYTTEIWRDDPSSQAITMWDCGCQWSDYSWGRTRQWKKYEGRPCSHTLALFWEAQTAPLTSEEPEAGGVPRPEPGGGMNEMVPLDGVVQPFDPSDLIAPFGRPQPAGPAEPLPVMEPQPGPESLINPAPPVSMPTVPTKDQSPLAIPGAFSKVAAFQNGQIVRNKFPLYGEEPRSGTPHMVPQNSGGEVIWSDDKEAVVIFPLESGELGPHLIKVFCQADEIYVDPKGQPFTWLKHHGSEVQPGKPRIYPDIESVKEELDKGESVAFGYIDGEFVFGLYHGAIVDGLANSGNPLNYKKLMEVITLWGWVRKSVTGEYYIASYSHYFGEQDESPTYEVTQKLNEILGPTTETPIHESDTDSEQ